MAARGFHGPLLNCLKAYLSKGIQRIVIHGQTYLYVGKSISAGVPFWTLYYPFLLDDGSNTIKSETF